MQKASEAKLEASVLMQKNRRTNCGITIQVPSSDNLIHFTTSHSKA